MLVIFEYMYFSLKRVSKFILLILGLTCLRYFYILFYFFASLSRSCNLYPSFTFSAAMLLLHVYLGLSLLRFPCVLFFDILSVCPMHRNFLFFNSTSTEYGLDFLTDLCFMSSHAIKCLECA